MFTRKGCLHATLGLLLTAICMSVPSSSFGQSADDYRDVLLDLVELVDRAQSNNMLKYQRGSFDLAIMDLVQGSDEDLMALFGGPMSLADMQRMIADAHAEIDLAEASKASKSGIDIPDIDVSVQDCADVVGAEYFVALAVSKITSGILAADKFVCLQEEAGVNAATLCVGFSELALIAEETTEFFKFCLDEIRAAKGRAILDLDRNIGAYLNEFVDDTTMSSRATQDSIDDVQDDVTTALTDINTIQSDLDASFSILDSDLDTALGQLTSLSSDLTDLIATAADIQFRTQENQVDIEDVQTRTADLQSTSDEIRTDTQSIIDLLDDLQQSADGLISTIDGQFDQLQLDAIAAVLSDPDSAAADYALPQSAGGQLELAREVVIQATVDLQNLGLGNPKTALQLITQGDQAYNAQDYTGAYNAFAEAYRTLTVSSSNFRRQQ